MNAKRLEEAGRTTPKRLNPAEKRARERKVVQLETLMRGRRLSVDEAVETVRHQQEIWKKEREDTVAKISDWHARNAAIQAFWSRKDAELDELLEEARRTLDRVMHRKRIIEVPPRENTLLESKLRAALDPDGRRKKFT